VSVYDQTLFLRALSDFTRHLLTPHDTEAALTDLASQVSEILGLRGSGVSLGRGEVLVFATVVPERLAMLEQVQQEHQAGPCVTAYREARVVAIEDLAEHSERWPEYCRVAESIEVSSVASLPMQLHGVRVGALNLYGRGPRSWSSDDLAAAVVMADMATGYLINASVLQHQEELNEQLQMALASRIAIEQAKGILAHKHRISVDQAFDRLRRHARAHNQSLRKLAQAVVDGDVSL
jgi:GAF domain-containing protein